MENGAIDWKTPEAAAAINAFFWKAGMLPLPEGDRMLPQIQTVTPANVQMSPRMSRCYSYLASRGVSLTSFSTDQDVLRQLGKLTAARDHLAAAVLAHSTPARLECILDIESIMRRVPANRVNALQTATQAPRERSHGLIAVSTESATTGAVVYWRLHGDVELSALLAACETQGIASELRPALCSPEVALSRAVREVGSRQILTRKHPQGGWAVVKERVVTEDNGKRDLDFDVIARVYLTADGIGAERTPGFDAESEIAVIKAEYAHMRASLSTVDISAWLVALSHSLSAVSLREQGGVYFFPNGGSLDTLHKVKAALSACAKHVIEEIPATRSEDAIKAIVNALTQECTDEITAMENELLDGDLGKRKAANRIEQVTAFKVKVRSYSALLGAAATKITDEMIVKLDAVKAKYQACSTRTNNLEID